MNSLKLDNILELVNKEKLKRGLDDYTPLYPMLRVSDNVLYIGVMLTKKNASVWDKDASIKPEYWILLDINDNHILEFNETKEKDFVLGTLIPKDLDNKQKEISKYEVKKARI